MESSCYHHIIASSHPTVASVIASSHPTSYGAPHDCIITAYCASHPLCISHHHILLCNTLCICCHHVLLCICRHRTLLCITSAVHLSSSHPAVYHIYCASVTITSTVHLSSSHPAVHHIYCASVTITSTVHHIAHHHTHLSLKLLLQEFNPPCVPMSPFQFAPSLYRHDWRRRWAVGGAMV